MVLQLYSVYMMFEMHSVFVLLRHPIYVGGFVMDESMGAS